jgi:mannan endo-1,4-beta-mannosidase
MKIALAALTGSSVLALAACTPLTGAAPAAVTSPAAAVTSAPLRISPPAAGVFETNRAASFRLVREFGAAAARPTIVLSFSGWWVPFNRRLAQDVRGYDAIPLIQLDPGGIALEKITNGRSGAYLRAFAVAVRAFGHPVILGFGHEMNGTWYSWGAGHVRPAVFVAAWRRVVQVFRAEGASNVTWLWTVNSVNAAGSPLSQWWPGSAWVSWVGIDGYYYRGADTFRSVFGRTISQVREFTSAPVLLSETAVGPSSQAASQVAGLFAGIRAARLLGLVWFDQAQHKPPYHLDWHLADDPQALAAFRAAAASK